MPWMKLTMVIDGEEPVETVVNTDTISRFTAYDGGAQIKFSDGSSIIVADSVDEIIQVVLTADEKKK